MQREIKNLIVDFTNVKYYLEMHAVIRESLEFPVYYGNNWDACWDCLKEIAGEPVHIRIIGMENIEKRFPTSAKYFLDLLKDFKNYDNKKYADITQIEIVDSNSGKISILE